MRLLDQDQFPFVILSAIQAPSADNHHRVKFSGNAEALSIHYTDGRLPPEGSYRRVLALLSLGAMAENIAVAASRYGIGAAMELLPEPACPDLLLRIRFGTAPAEADLNALWPAIAARHTNRHVRLHGPPLTDEQRLRLERSIQNLHSCRLRWLDGPALKSRAIRLMRQAETERFRNPALHAELFSAIRFDAGWRRSATEGLPPGALGIEPPLRPFFATLRHWPLMRTLTLVGMHHLLGFRSCELPCRLSPNLALVTVRSFDNHSTFDAGRALQRTWLGLTALGFAMQPMPAAALYALPGACDEGIPQDLQKHLAKGWQSIAPGQHPLLAFRIGRARASAIVAGRPPAEHYWSP